MKKLVILVTIICIVLGIMTFVFKGFHNGSLFNHHSHFLADSGAWIPSMYNIAKFEMPENYQLLRWMEGFKQGPKYTAIGIFGETKQPADFLALYRMPLHRKVDPGDVEIIKETLKPTYFKFMQSVWNTAIIPDHEFVYALVRVYIPFFWRFEDNAKNRTLILRGLDQKEYKELETDKIRAYVWYGNFREIFFDKKPDSFFKYWITSLYFPKERHGGIALVQDKETEATFFAIQSSILSIPVDKQKFEKFLRSIDFDTEVFDPNHNLAERKAKLAKKGIKLSSFTISE